MAVVYQLPLPSFFPPPSPPRSLSHSLYSLAPSSFTRSRATTASLSSSMDLRDEGRRKFMEFPYVSAPRRDLMVDLVSAVENRFDSKLLPCTLPPDVQCFQNQNGTAQASLHIRRGVDSSPIDFILGSWIHCELPTGGALNITSLSTYLNSSTDAPNFMVELIQSSPTTLILILDLPPRKDLVLNPDYLKTFYEETKLESQRQMLEKVPEVKPYFTTSLYLRTLSSPTVIMVRIETQEGERMEEIIQKHVHPIAKEVMGIWLDQCACGDREVSDTERTYLVERDRLVKNKTIEIDLASSFPRLFGQEAADRVLESIREVFT